jgi:hypothetical protein
LELPHTAHNAFLITENAHEKDPLHLEIDLNDLPQRKKFLAQRSER